MADSGCLLGLCLMFFSCISFGFTFHEHELYQHLFKDYEKWVRPAMNNEDEVTVAHGLSLQQLVSLEDEVLTAFVWENLHWKDFRLSWNSSKYGGVGSIRAPTSKVWMPDIQMYNSLIDTRYWAETKVVIYSDGSVVCVPPLHISTSCPMDMRHFPRDQQRCRLKFGSWTYDGSKLNLTSRYENMDISSYSMNAEWSLLDHEAERSVMLYDCCPDPYVDITYMVHLRRRDNFHTYVMVAPVVLLLLMTPFIFLSSPNNSLKMTFGVGLLISVVIALWMISGFIPRRSFALPLLVKFYICSMTLVSLSLVLSMIVSHVASKSIYGSHPPEFLRKLFVDWIGRLCCVKRDDYMLHRSSVAESGLTASDTTLTKPQAHGHVSDWFLIAAVIDKVLLIVFLVVCVVCAVAFFTG